MEFELKTVLISDDVDQQCIDILSSGGIQVVKNTKLTKDQLTAEIAVNLNLEDLFSSRTRRLEIYKINIKYS